VAALLVGAADPVGHRRDFTVGDEVYAPPRDLRIGAFAEQIAIDADDVALKPASLSFEEAAAVPLVALAAWQALVDLADVQPGQRVLVHAGAGGLGSTVIQVAKHLGAHVATTAHTKDVDRVRALGAEEVVDYTQEDFTDVVSGYDVVLDSLGPASLEKSLTVLRPGGLAISVVGPPDPGFAVQLGHPLLRPVMAVVSREIRRQARRLGVRYSFFFMRASGTQLASLAALYDAGTLRPCSTGLPVRPDSRRPELRGAGQGQRQDRRDAMTSVPVNGNRRGARRHLLRPGRDAHRQLRSRCDLPVPRRWPPSSSPSESQSSTRPLQLSGERDG
jgi:NADPH:quinone reductase-like Zn-dependent oxidoreductase